MALDSVAVSIARDCLKCGVRVAAPRRAAQQPRFTQRATRQLEPRDPRLVDWTGIAVASCGLTEASVITPKSSLPEIQLGTTTLTKRRPRGA